MNKLLRANFARLWKSTIFRISMGLIVLISLHSVLNLYIDCPPNLSDYPPDLLDSCLFTGNVYMILVIAVFISLFIGTEYSDGTIRNKLIVGQTRYAIYFSNLIVCISALLIMYFTYIIVLIGIGSLLLENIQLNLETNITLHFISIITIIALSSIFLFMSMLIHSKPIGSVTVIIVSFVLLISANSISSSLKRPEYYYAESESYTDELGIHHEEFSKKTKNPRYLEGTKREIYKFLYDFLPSCQILQLANGELSKPANLLPYPLVKLPLYSLGIIVVTTTCGVFFFRKKELK